MTKLTVLPESIQQLRYTGAIPSYTLNLGCSSFFFCEAANFRVCSMLAQTSWSARMVFNGVSGGLVNSRF